MNRPTAIQLLSQSAFSATGFLVPVLAASVGAGPVAVGAIGATFGGAQFLASAVGGRLADMHGRRRLLKIGLAASTVACLGHLLVATPEGLALARAAFGFAAGLFPPALLSIAYDRNRRLGRFTGWGGLGFAVGSFLGGVATAGVTGLATDLRPVFLLSTALLLASYLVALTVRERPRHDVIVHLFPTEVVRRNLPAYVAMLVRHVGAAAVWIVFPLYLVDLGVPLGWVGFIHAVNGVFQFFAMPFADRYRPVPLVLAGCGMSAAVFAGFHVSTNVWHFLLLQPLLAASWAALYMGTLKYVLEDRSEERATATGLLQSSVQLSNVVGPALGGVVAWRWGYHATFVVGVVGSLAAAAVFLAEVRASRARSRAAPGAAE